MVVEVSERELERRRKISETRRKSPKCAAYYARIRGVPRGPDSLETRAKKSASHRARRGSRAWQVCYRTALARMKLEDLARDALAATE